MIEVKCLELKLIYKFQRTRPIWRQSGYLFIQKIFVLHILTLDNLD